MIQIIDREKCFGCGNCDLACPLDVIYLDSETRTAEIRYLHDCQTCFNCEIACPSGAILVDPMKKEKPQPW